MKLIDKAALVAEINELKSAAETMLTGKTDLSYWKAQKFVSEKLLSFIDTHKVKEVDLEKEIDDYVNVHFSECNDGVLLSDANSMELTLLDITPLAKYFFELGLEAQKGK